MKENSTKLIVVSVDDLVFLECFKLAHGATRNIRLFIGRMGTKSSWFALRVINCSSMTFNKFHTIGVDDAMILAANTKVVGD